MRLLLDTHYLLWALDRPEVMPAAARRAIEDQANDVLFSAASVWELAIKAALGRADFQVDPGKVAEAARETGFRELAVTAEHACVVAGLPMHHRDPFDRLLVAQALALPARLLTADAALQPYSELVWLAPSES